MASHVSVVNTAFNRIKVAVTPGKHMIEVRDEVCTKSKTKTKNYDLKYKNKLIDLSQTFRQTGLPPGASLELIVASRSAGVVSVALQTPGDGGRLMDKFSSDTTLWQILRKFESTEGKNLNFTGRGVTDIQNGAASGAGRIFYEMPSLHILGRDCSTFGDLQKTLQQLGINSGSALVRLSFKKTEQPFEEAITEIGQYFKDEEAAGDAGAEGSGEAKLEAAPAAEVVTITEAVARLASAEPSSFEEKDSAITSQGASEDTTQDPTPYPETAGDDPLPITPSKRPAPSSSEDPISEPSQRRIEVYLPPSSDTPQAALAPHNEEDFEPGISHLKSYQGRLTNNAQNKRLPSDAEIERQEVENAVKLAAVKELQIMIRFPDQNRANARLPTDANANTLYDWVKNVIVAGDQPFKLIWTDNKGTRTVPRDEKKKLVKDLGFSVRMLINFVWEEGANDVARKTPTLKPEVLKLAKELQVPEVAKANSKENEADSRVDKGKGKEGEDGGSKKGKGGMPSWLLKGLSKK